MIGGFVGMVAGGCVSATAIVIVAAIKGCPWCRDFIGMSK